MSDQNTGAEANGANVVQSDVEKQGDDRINSEDQTQVQPAPSETVAQEQGQGQQEAQNMDVEQAIPENASNADNQSLQHGKQEAVPATDTIAQEGDAMIDPSSNDKQIQSNGDGPGSAAPASQQPPESAYDTSVDQNTESAYDTSVDQNTAHGSHPVASTQPGQQNVDGTQGEANQDVQSKDGPTESSGDHLKSLDQQQTSTQQAQAEDDVSNVDNRQTSILVSKATGETAIFMDEMEGGGVQSTPVATMGEGSTKTPPKGKVVTESPPASPSTLNGTFRTPKGRILEGDELATSLGRLALPHGLQAPEQVLDGEGVIKTREKWEPEPKFISQDNLASMIDRLSTSKATPELPPKPAAVILKFERVPGAKGDYVPAPKVSKSEQIEALGGLYNRCKELKSKMKEKLAEKYLQPLAQAKQVSGAEAIEEHKKKLQRLYEGHGAADR